MLKYFVILAFLVLLVGCGENLNPIVSEDSTQVKMELPKEIIGSDGAPMVLIPAGEFQMGSDENESEKPVHTVYLDAFYMDKYEVTNAQYQKFVQATSHEDKNRKEIIESWGERLNGDDQPVVFVSWEDANAYAKWAGKRLPTKAEWEKAARGGLVGKRYVWGDEWPPPPRAGNFRDESYHRDELYREKIDTKFFILGYDDGYTLTAPVGSFTPNGYGLYDMVGNVAEWCADWRAGDLHMFSGSSFRWGTNHEDNTLWVTYYFYNCAPGIGSYDVGFRCAMDATK
ncbi:MAG: formylglycine-generating enzyme family protein [Candidatus Doudnabacteria bacterium]